MASFLGTHHCDDLCRLLGLPPFVLSPKRRREMQAGHLEHVRKVEAAGEEGVGDGSVSEVSSAGGTAGSSMKNVSSQGSSPSGTAFKARDAMLAGGGGSSKLGAGRKHGSNPLLATLFRQAFSLLPGGGGTSTKDDAAAAAASRELPPASLASLPRCGCTS
jgi:hypothetical protein